MQFQTSPIRHVGNRLTCADFKQFAGMFAAILSGKRSRWYPGTYGNFYSIQASRQKRIIECDPNVDLYAFCDISKKRCAFLLTLAEHLLRMLLARRRIIMLALLVLSLFTVRPNCDGSS
ncbi:MAG: hypothetical protein DMG14_29600 [Acidobacteria bacterium]|nr:MAG: hypothetical protein DMG14_29600 [Acidobacteriota bacterium]